MIKGSLDGEIVSEGLLIVGPTAKVSAKVTTKNLVSHGEIIGDVTASEQVVLKADRRPNGEHHHPGHRCRERLPLQRVAQDGTALGGQWLKVSFRRKSQDRLPPT